METLGWGQVLAWRLRRQFLDPIGAHGAVDVVRRLAGVQAQVASAAELAVAVRGGAPMYVLTEHVDELAAMSPSAAVRLLGGFDAYVLGAGTDAEYIIAAEHRAQVSRTAGWISPVVLHGGRVAGVWEAVKNGDIRLSLWETVPAAPLKAETARLTKLLT
jgi:Winged helix DNA-binding domain